MKRIISVALLTLSANAIASPATDYAEAMQAAYSFDKYAKMFVEGDTYVERTRAKVAKENLPKSTYKMKAATACRELKAEGAKSIKKVRIELIPNWGLGDPQMYSHTFSC